MEQLQALCESYGCSLLDIAMGWLAQPPGSEQRDRRRNHDIEQLEQNVKAGEWRPDRAQREAIDKITAPVQQQFGPARR